MTDFVAIDNLTDSSEMTDTTKAQYLPISVSSLSAEATLGFDLYQEEGNSYRLYRHRSLPFGHDDIAKLVELGWERLYVPATQRKSFHKHMRQNMGVFLKDPAIPASEKTAMLTESSVELLASVMEEPESEENLRAISEQCDNHVMMALMGEEERESLRLSRANGPRHLAHAITVSNLSILLGLNNNVDDSSKLHELGVGALLHEIGKTVLDRDYYTRNEGERVLAHIRLKKYPVIGARILEESGVINSISCKSVTEHQERLDGSGYPAGLKGSDICEFSRIVAICDYFDEQVNPESAGHAVSPFEVLRRMKAASDKFDQKILIAFIRLLGGVDNPASSAGSHTAKPVLESKETI